MIATVTGCYGNHIHAKQSLIDISGYRTGRPINTYPTRLLALSIMEIWGCHTNIPLPPSPPNQQSESCLTGLGIHRLRLSKNKYSALIRVHMVGECNSINSDTANCWVHYLPMCSHGKIMSNLIRTLRFMGFIRRKKTRKMLELDYIRFNNITVFKRVQHKYRQYVMLTGNYVE